MVAALEVTFLSPKKAVQERITTHCKISLAVLERFTYIAMRNWDEHFVVSVGARWFASSKILKINDKLLKGGTYVKRYQCPHFTCSPELSPDHLATTCSENYRNKKHRIQVRCYESANEDGRQSRSFKC